MISIQIYDNLSIKAKRKNEDIKKLGWLDVDILLTATLMHNGNSTLLQIIYWSTIYTCRKEQDYNVRDVQISCCLRNRSVLAVNYWVVIHCLEVSYNRLTVKKITQQFTHQSRSIAIVTHKKRWKSSCILQNLPTFCHCTEEIPPKVWL